MTNIVFEFLTQIGTVIINIDPINEKTLSFAPNLKKKTIVKGDINKEDIEAYFNIIFEENKRHKFYIGCYYDTFMSLFRALEKYPEDRPFSHVCSVAHQFGDVRFPPIAECIFTRKDINDTRDFIVAYNEYNLICSNYTSCLNSVSRCKKKLFWEKYDKYELSAINKKRFELKKKLPTLTFAMIKVMEVEGSVQYWRTILSYVTYGNIDLRNMYVDALHELSHYILTTITIWNSEKEKYKSTFMRNSLNIPEELFERWKMGRPETIEEFIPTIDDVFE